jgi:hypothetical protein
MIKTLQVIMRKMWCFTLASLGNFGKRILKVLKMKDGAYELIKEFHLAEILRVWNNDALNRAYISP